MSTNLALDDNLILKAQKIGNFKTKKETVTVALQEFIKRAEQMEILSLFNSVPYDEQYDYKKTRSRK